MTSRPGSRVAPLLQQHRRHHADDEAAASSPQNTARQFIGRYRYKLKRTDTGLKIQERRAILDAEELGAMGAVSFLL